MVAVLVILSGMAGYLLEAGTVRPTTFTTTLTSTTTVTMPNTTFTTTRFYTDQGASLRLVVTVNATVIHQGGAISARIELQNPLDLNVSAVTTYRQNGTLTTWAGLDFICGGGGLTSVVGFAVLGGHYSAGNLSAAGVPLTLAPGILPPCAIFTMPSLLVFLPYGSEAWEYGQSLEAPPTLVHVGLNASTGVCSATDGGGMCGPAGGLFGYWDLTGMQGSANMSEWTTSSRYFHYFEPGWYTLVAAAAWGQMVVENFEVV